MIIHPWDAAEEREALAFVRNNEFGHLIAAGRDRDVPVVVPTQFLLADDRTVLLHLARPNPIWRAIEENPAVMLSIAGAGHTHPAAGVAPHAAATPPTEFRPRTTPPSNSLGTLRSSRTTSAKQRSCGRRSAGTNLTEDWWIPANTPGTSLESKDCGSPSGRSEESSSTTGISTSRPETI